ncbi:MAG: DUF6933 domain-containing protein [Planctomycetota bacterium]
MLLRVTGKLGKKISERSLEKLPPAENPLLDWSCNVFRIDRKQHIIAINTRSLLPVFMYGRGVTDAASLLERVTDNICRRMAAMGLADECEEYVRPAADTLRLSKSLNRSVTGSMNDFVHQVEAQAQIGNFNCEEWEARAGVVPMGALDMDSSGKAFREMVREVGEKR